MAMIPLSAGWRSAMSTNEVNAGHYQARQEVSIATTPVQLGNDELGAIHSAGLDSLGKLGPIRVLPVLDLH